MNGTTTTTGTLRAGDYRLDFDLTGGTVNRFDFTGEPLFQAGDGPSPLDRASFPLVPFSNRIARGRFRFGDRDVTLAPNFPGGGHPHPLHGFGWLAHWRLDAATATSCAMRHEHGGGEWPWRYRATQRLELSDDGLLHRLSIENLSDAPMPAGLGLHPYLPRTALTVLHGLHRGEWATRSDGIPTHLAERDAPIDWWDGRPVGSRSVDTVYTDREGVLSVAWPERNLALWIEPTSDLPHTVIYAPSGADFFCVEPVSHRTDALNGDPEAMRTIPPGGEWTCGVRFRARRIEPA